MDRHKVYISSTYRDLADYRARVINFFLSGKMPDSFSLISMEGYVADDIQPSDKCVEDVAKCDIYILIVAKRYGFIPPDTTKNPGRFSITEMEYETAVSHNKIILTFLADEKQVFEEDSDPDAVLLAEKKQKLLAFKEKVRLAKLTHPDGFTDAYHLCFQVQQAIFNKFFTEIYASREENLDKIYFCDRRSQNYTFQKGRQINKAIQFFLINSHEKDMAHFFVKRIGLECIESDIRTLDLFIYPTILDNSDFDDLEFSMRCAIKEEWNRNAELKKFKLKDPLDVSVEKVLSVMDELNYDCLIISWEIKSFYWKNDKLNENISAFYEKYDQVNATLKTSKKIFFIGTVSYSECADMTFAQFEDKIKSIRYGATPIKLTRINRNEIKDWMTDFEIEDNPNVQEKLLHDLLPGPDPDFYLSDLELPLRNILMKL